ncbi:hypothetical protein LX32DRAFT_628887 [Colletotrichum zoysiae]|uniref:Uncharacterized protein n=1 Tax=Colletotrichum zoysiae TaxID=1216348 RepID=A0AAD9H7W9_9PEZI|nr:hypothetical protein LX32DRAFT_628887 [Colletotrichum zoysiae]
MKSSTVMPALLALAQAAAIPEVAKPVAVPDSVLDDAIRDPLINYVDGPVQGDPVGHPIYGLPFDPWDPNPLSANPWQPYRESEGAEEAAAAARWEKEEDPAVGGAAWAVLELHAIAALDDPEDGPNPERLVTLRARDLAETAKGTTGALPNSTLPADFHRGLTQQQICSAFLGITWKTGELLKPVYQWQPEYVPWLVENKGPYMQVLDGLRHIEWVLWKIRRGLQYTTLFTPEEEHAIMGCYYHFSGIEWQITRPYISDSVNNKTTLEPPALPGRKGVRPSGIPEPQWPHPIKGKEMPVVIPGHSPWFHRHPSLKKLLRVITAKAPVSRYQTYANDRIHNVLRNLETSNVAKALMDSFEIQKSKDQILYDIEKDQGIERALSLAKHAYDRNTIPVRR